MKASEARKLTDIATKRDARLLGAIRDIDTAARLGKSFVVLYKFSTMDKLLDLGYELDNNDNDKVTVSW